MDKFEKHIDKIIQKVLNEAAEDKASEVSEKLHGDQKKIDKNKNGKIDSEDFKLLRKKEAKEGFEDEIDIDRMDMNPEEDDEEDMDVDFSEFDPRDKSWEEIKAHTGAPDYSEIDEEPEYIDPKDGELDEDESMPGDYEGDEEAEEEAEELSAQEPTYVGRGLEDNKMKANIKNKIFGSFTDTNDWYDETDRDYKGEFDFDYDEEEFDEFEPLYAKYGDKTSWFAPGDEGKKFFNMYKDRFGPMIVRVAKGLEEDAETEEGNEFTGALADAKKEGKKTFDVDGKTYPVKESKEKKCAECGMINCKCNHKKETKEKWEGDVEVKKTGEYSDMSIEELNKAIKKQKSKNDRTKEANKKVSHADKTKMSQLYFAKRAKQGWKGKGKAAVKESLQLTEDEVIDLIEKVVLEQKKVKDKAEKNNLTNKKPEGLKKTEKVLNADKKENDDYAKSVVKKMKEYVKAGSVGEYNESPETFPQSNYTMGKMKEKTMKYHPSDAVDEYIEAFAFPGMTNLVFDEIKPDEKKIEKYLKGDSTTGNATKDKDGKALGNVVPSEVGERFMKNFEDNLYGAEQMNVSYKRQPQPVDVNGSEKVEGSLKSIRKGSTAKAGKIMSQLESQENRNDKLINEEMIKMKSLINYNKKTQ